MRELRIALLLQIFFIFSNLGSAVAHSKQSELKLLNCVAGQPVAISDHFSSNVKIGESGDEPLGRVEISIVSRIIDAHTRFEASIVKIEDNIEYGTAFSLNKELRYDGAIHFYGISGSGFSLKRSNGRDWFGGWIETSIKNDANFVFYIPIKCTI